MRLGFSERKCYVASGDTLYNVRVADYHTYFVGCQEWGFSVWAHNTNCTAQGAALKAATAQRHAAYGQDLGRIEATLARVGQRALREARRGGKTDWQGRGSEALLFKYGMMVENRLRRVDSPFQLLWQPAGMPGTRQRVPSRFLGPGADVISQSGSRRADIGVIDRRMPSQDPLDPTMRPLVAGIDITQKNYPANPAATWRNPASYNDKYEKPADIASYYYEAFGVPIIDQRRLGDWRGRGTNRAWAPWSQ